MNLKGYKNIARYALYDAGNSNYVTLIPALGFPIYFKTFIAPNGASVDMLWGVMIVLSTLLAGLLGPKIGELADRTGSKFSLLRWTSWAAVAGTAAFSFLHAGQVLAASALFVITHTCYLLATMLYDAALADVSSKENAASVSSLAWGVGYAGGLIGLLFVLTTTDAGASRFKAIFLIAAAMFLVLSLPLVLLRRSGKASAKKPAIRKTRTSLPALVRAFMREGVRSRMFWAFFLYSNGVSSVIYFTALYATTTLAYSLDGLMWLFVAMNVVAAPSAIVFGQVAKRVGHIRTLKAVVTAWILVVLVIVVVDARTFAIFACIAATLIGPVQALSRSLFRIIFPDDSMSAFFGVQSIAVRGSALVGPLLFGVTSWLTGSQRIGALTAAVLFGAGLLVLFLVPGDADRGSTKPVQERAA